MEIFINEMSLHAQYNDNSEFGLAVEEFISIVSEIKRTIRNKSFYKDSNIVFDREAIINQNFLSSLGKIKDKFFQKAFKEIIFDTQEPIDWRTEQKHNSNDIFICELINDIVTNTSLAEVAERKIQNNEQIYVLINFINSVFSKSQRIEIRKNDCENTLVDCFNSKNEALIWIENNYSEPLILKTNNFRPTSLTSCLNTKIYEEKETGYWWYFDNFHRTHFEVFNKQKIHLGEADLTGKLIPNSADPSKNGKLTI